MMKALSFSDLSFNWAVCYQAYCPLTTRCLRLNGGSVLPLSRQTWPAVNPKQRSSDGCPLFVADEPVRMAYGMKGLDRNLNVIEAQQLHNALYEFFGSRSRYYRFRNCCDDRPNSVSGFAAGADAASEANAARHTFGISPGQQAAIAEIFHRLGLKGEPQFDHYETQYHFPEP